MLRAPRLLCRASAITLCLSAQTLHRQQRRHGQQSMHGSIWILASTIRLTIADPQMHVKLLDSEDPLTCAITAFDS